MARDLNGSSHYLSRNAALATTVPFTFACWINPDATSDEVVFSLGISSDTSEYSSLMIRNADAKLLAASIDAGSASTASNVSTNAVSTGVWSHVGGVWTNFNNGAGTGIRAYLNGAVGSSVGVQNATPEGTYNQTAVGALWRTTASGFFDGRIADAAFWNVGLTADEMASLAAGASPLSIRPQSLVAYWPLLARATDEEDWVGGNTLTNNSAAASDEYPPLIRRRRQTNFMIAGGSGGGGGGFQAAWARNRNSLIYTGAGR